MCFHYVFSNKVYICSFSHMRDLEITIGSSLLLKLYFLKSKISLYYKTSKPVPGMIGPLKNRVTLCMWLQNSCLMESWRPLKDDRRSILGYTIGFRNRLASMTSPDTGCTQFPVRPSYWPEVLSLNYGSRHILGGPREEVLLMTGLKLSRTS